MTPGINTLLLSTGALGSFTCSGMTLLIYMGPTALRGIRATGDTLSNVESQVFTPYKFGSTAGDRTPDLLTTRPTCYHSATALCNLPSFFSCSLQVYYPAVVVVGITGNILNIIIMTRPSMINYSSTIYLLGLAVADITVLIFQTTFKYIVYKGWHVVNPRGFHVFQVMPFC